MPASLTTPPDADTPVVSAPGMAQSAEAATPLSPMAGRGAGQLEGPDSQAPDQASAAVSAQPDPGDVAAPVPAEATSSSTNGMEHYARLQRRLLVATAAAVALAVPLTGWLFGGSAALSLLLGGLGGLLYLRLLARSVSRLGGDRRSVGKVQLLVPVALVLAAARIPSLQILPALLGFLLYKPALIVQALLDA